MKRLCPHGQNRSLQKGWILTWDEKRDLRQKKGKGSSKEVPDTQRDCTVVEKEETFRHPAEGCGDLDRN